MKNRDPKNLTQEEIWQPLYSCGYRFQFQGDLKPLHPDKSCTAVL